MKQIWTWLTKTFMNPWWALCVACAFLCFGSIVSVDTKWADSFDGNWLFITLAIVFGFGAFYFILKANKTSGGNTGFKQ